MRRLSILLLLIPALIVVSCSKGGVGAATQGTTVASAATATPIPARATATPVLVTTAVQSPVAAVAPAGATVQGTVHVDFTGAPKELDAINAPFNVATGSTAWDAVKMAIGEANLDYKDYGGDLGIFVNGFDGVKAEGNHFWEFQVNGVSSQVGVGKYEVKPGDVLEFVYSSY